MTPEEKKLANKLNARAKRLRDKGIKFECEICGRKYQKGKFYAHKKTQYHTIALLEGQIENLTQKN